MYVLVTYDVSTKDAAGRKRLRRVAKTCLDFGQRVQNSVFELSVDPGQWAECRGRLLDEADLNEDSLRFYMLGNNWKRRVEHHGTKPSLDMDGPLVRVVRTPSAHESPVTFAIDVIGERSRT